VFNVPCNIQQVIFRDKPFQAMNCTAAVSQENDAENYKLSVSSKYCWCVGVHPWYTVHQKTSVIILSCLLEGEKKHRQWESPTGTALIVRCLLVPVCQMSATSTKMYHIDIIYLGLKCCRCNCTFQVGVLEDEYSCLGIFCAIAFFPLGLLCCLAMKQRVCPNCGAVFGWTYKTPAEL